MIQRAMLAVLAFTSCEGRDPGVSPVESVGTQKQELLRRVGLSFIRQGIIIGNSMSTEQLNHNTLTTRSAANFALTHNALNDTSFASVPELHDSLESPASVAVMSYLVGCALSPEQKVSWSNGVTSRTFWGQAGLCTDWATLMPGTTVSDSCQELVSACLLARNNHLGVHVPLSIRGDDSVGGEGLSAGEELGAWDYSVARGVDIASVNGCSSPSSGDARDCGWRSVGVFQCAPHAPIVVGVGAPATGRCSDTASTLGSRSGDVGLRLCNGISACDLASRTGSPVLCGGGFSMPGAVMGTCDSSGFMNVMAAPYSSTDTTSTYVLDTRGLVAVGEKNFFDIREGAFYGNIFDPGALAYEVTWDPKKLAQVITPPLGPTSPKVVYGGMYACADERWADSEAYEWGALRDGRLCALGACASNYAGRCETEAFCTPDSSNDGEERTCTGGGVTWKWGLTTFLHDACALTSQNNPQRCKRL
jgi:hypothetical protein